MRSAVRSTGNTQHQNQHAEQTGEQTGKPPMPAVRSALDNNNAGEAVPLVIIDPVNLIGTTFDIPNKEGTKDQCCIVKTIHNHHNASKNASRLTEFCIICNRDDLEEVIIYNQVRDHIEKQGEEPIQCEIDQIVGHQERVSQLKIIAKIHQLHALSTQKKIICLINRDGNALKSLQRNTKSC